MTPHTTEAVLRERGFARLLANRSRPALALFGACAIGTALIAAWGARMAASGDTHHLAPIFFVLFAILDVRASMWLEIAILLALVVAPFVDGDRVARWVSQRIALIATVTGLLLCVGTLVVYHDHPVSMDEYAQLFQSRIFARGALAGHFPTGLIDWLIAPGFQNYFLSISKVTGAVASTYWPSFALMLAPFTAIGMSWALNPLLSALTLLATHRLAWRVLDDRQAAGWAVLFTVASPVFFANGISYYTMTAHLLCNTAFALLLLEPTRARAIAAGVVGAVALTLHNPVPHLLFALPWIVWTATRPGGMKRLAWLAVGYLPLGLLLGLGWFLFSTELRGAGLVAAAQVTNSAVPAAGDSPLTALHRMLSVFTLPDATVLLARAVGLAKVWLWAAPGLLVLAVAGGARAWHLTPVRVLAASALLTLFGYVLVPVDQGHGWGYRYFHSSWVALPVLAAAAMRGQGDDRRWWAPEGPKVRAFVAAGALLSVFVVVPARAWQMQDFIGGLVSQVPDCSARAEQRRVVIINTGQLFYGADLVQNDPWLRGNEIRMLSRGAEGDAAMMSAVFPRLEQACHDARGAVWVERPAGR